MLRLNQLGRASPGTGGRQDSQLRFAVPCRVGQTHDGPCRSDSAHQRHRRQAGRCPPAALAGRGEPIARRCCRVSGFARAALLASITATTRASFGLVWGSRAVRSCWRVGRHGGDRGALGVIGEAQQAGCALSTLKEQSSEPFLDPVACCRWRCDGACVDQSRLPELARPGSRTDFARLPGEAGADLRSCREPLAPIGAMQCTRSGCRPDPFGRERPGDLLSPKSPTESLPAREPHESARKSGCERRLGCELLTRAAQRNHQCPATATEFGGEPAL